MDVAFNSGNVAVGGRLSCRSASVGGACVGDGGGVDALGVLAGSRPIVAPG
jgi:hypothetical protein